MKYPSPPRPWQVPCKKTEDSIEPVLKFIAIFALFNAFFQFYRIFVIFVLITLYVPESKW